MISLDSTQEEEAVRVFEMVDSEEEDFEVFDQPYPTESPCTISRPLPSAQISSNQELADIPEAMVLLRKKNTSLLELLKSHVGRSIPEVVVQPQPPTPFPTCTSPSDQLEKKRKKEKKGKEISEKGEIVPSKDPEP